MRKEEPSNNVKLAATNALLNSLEFTKANFDKEVQTGLRDRTSSPWMDRPGRLSASAGSVRRVWMFKLKFRVFLFQTERHFIMQVVCEATQCPDTRVSTTPTC